MTKKTAKLRFRRRAKGKTNYEKRLALLKSGKKRVVFRRSNKRITLQLVEFSPKGDKTLISVNSGQLKEYGWPGRCNIPTAYLTGLLLGTKALASNNSEAVFDMGLLTPVHGGRAFAALKGLVDSGLKVASSGEVFPAEERIAAGHIEAFAKKLGAEKEKAFSGYAKEGKDAAELGRAFNEARERIAGKKPVAEKQGEGEVKE